MYVFSNHRSSKSSVSVSLPIQLMLVFCSLMLIGDETWGAEKTAENPFENGWTLDSSSSSLNFQTISDGSNLEISKFDAFDGVVDESGSAKLRIQLDSVNTDEDLRNVRLRFLLFETYKFAEATVSTSIDPALLSTLSEKTNIEVPIEFELDFHGVKRPFQVQTVVNKLIDNQVSVSSVAPVSIETTLFDLDAGMKKLEESSNVSIVPMAAVSFNLVFNTGEDSTANKVAEGAEPKDTEAEGADAEGAEAEGAEAEGNEAEGAEAKDTDAEEAEIAEEIAETDAVVPVAVPVELPKEASSTEPDWAEESATYTSPYSETETAAAETDDAMPDKLSDEKCKEGFKAFSESGGIYFKTASARLDPKSISVLTAVVDLANRCSQFKLTVAGHTDSIGGRNHNQKLSELRALSVSEFLINNNVDRERLSAVGFGETKPLVPNDTRRNRERNRRIEFSVTN